MPAIWQHATSQSAATPAARAACEGEAPGIAELLLQSCSRKQQQSQETPHAAPGFCKGSGSGNSSGLAPSSLVQTCGSAPAGTRLWRLAGFSPRCGAPPCCWAPQRHFRAALPRVFSPPPRPGHRRPGEAASRLLPKTKMAARGACQHGAALPSRARLCGWRRARPRDAFNWAARNLRRRGARPRRERAGDQVTPTPTARPTLPPRGPGGV